MRRQVAWHIPLKLTLETSDCDIRRPSAFNPESNAWLLAVRPTLLDRLVLPPERIPEPCSSRLVDTERDVLLLMD